MGRLNRRDFMKALGLGSGVSMFTACETDNNAYMTPIEQVLPYVVRPEQVLPGSPTFFATTITTGAAAHPVLARHRDGRVINVGANRRAPLSPAVPKSALLELQKHYSPDRYGKPATRDGGSWAETTWDEGLKSLAGAVAKARKAGKKVAYLGPHRTGAIAELIEDFTHGEAVFWEPLSRAAERAAAERLFGIGALPAYDLSKAKYVLSFGAAFLCDWGGTQTSADYATARNPNIDHSVARFAAVTAHLDQTSANADDWFAATPGSEADVALAVAKLVADAKKYNGPLRPMLAKGDVARAAQRSGLSEDEIKAIAKHVADEPSVALPGGAKGGTDLALATFAINMVSGNAGKTFGFGTGYSGRMDGIARLKGLLDAMKGGQVGVLLLDDANPAYALPNDAAVPDALAKVETIVALSSHPDETNASAHLVLPTSNTFEDWGDEEPSTGLHLLRQPSMTPLRDTRSLGDILLATARAAKLQPLPSLGEAPTDDAAGNGGGRARPAAAAPAAGTEEEAAPSAPVLGFQPQTWRDYVRTRWERDLYQGAPGGFTRWWEQTLEAGFLDRRSGMAAPATVMPGVTPALGEREAGGGDYHLVVYPHPSRGDGRYANQPWAQEISDPMTGHVWDSWVEVSPATAGKLGIEDDALVEVSTEAGKVQLGVEVYKGIRDDCIAIAFGNGHQANGRYANGIGVNAVSLLQVKEQGGCMEWQQAKASIQVVGGEAGLVSTFGSDGDHGKHIAVSADAAALAKYGDAENAHPGELTGIHHLVRDPRLVATGNLDMYPAPDHPTHRFAMTVDTNACNGCGSCMVACSAENNLPIVGKRVIGQGREMNWLRINRVWTPKDKVPGVQFVPLMCQHCAHAPCESVCPVVATYHTLDGLNAMVYNRCVGTRYCANNCPYLARRFNFHTFTWPESLELQLNPEVTARTMGVMEKCTFCVQRIRDTKSAMKDRGHKGPVPDEMLQQLPACAEVCPSQALTFGNRKDPASTPAKTSKSGRTYTLLSELNTMSAVNYLAKANFHHEGHHGGGHGGGHGDGHGDDHGKADGHGKADDHGKADKPHDDAEKAGKAGKAGKAH